MRVDDYTPDNICEAMLGEPFDPGLLAGTQVRVVLQPSFHPEVVLSSRDSTGHATWEVDAFVEQFWLQPSPPSAFASWSARTTLTRDVARRITALLAALDGECSVGALGLDGMSYDMVIRQGDCAFHRSGCVTVDGRVRTFLRELEHISKTG